MKRSNKVIASLISVATLLSVASCGGNDRGSRPASETSAEQQETTSATVAPIETYETNKGVQDAVADVKIKEEYNPTKKLKWLSWYPIQESDSPVELFKANYGIPEEGDQSYGEYADCVTQYIAVPYNDRYDRLGQLVAAGDSPDIFPFQIEYFPLSAYKNMFQPIDGVIDTYSEEWADTREYMDQFMWGGKNYCPIITVGTSYLWYYRKSVIQDAGLPDPYELYREGNWNWDTFLDMADKFQKSGDKKYAVDGWYIPRSLVCTTGVPFVSIEDGKLVSHLNDPAVERAMDLVETLCAQNYAYPKVENNYQYNPKLWASGDILFFIDGDWFYGEQLSKFGIKYGWDEDEIFFVPAPRDPKADKYYQEMKTDPYMFVAGSTNSEGFKAWIECNLICSKDESIKAAAREKTKIDVPWTDEQLDFIDEIKTDKNLTALFEFKYGISTSCADSTSGNSPMDILVSWPLNSTDNKFTNLRAQYEGEINAAIEELNASVS